MVGNTQGHQHAIGGYIRIINLLAMTKYIQIGGKDRPLKFGFAALYEYEQRTGRLAIPDLDSMTDPNRVSVSIMMDLLYSGFVCGAREESANVDFTIQDVAGWFNSFEQAVQVINMIREDIEADPADIVEGNGKPGKPTKSKATPDT